MGIWWECGKRNGFAGLVPAQEVGEHLQEHETIRGRSQHLDQPW
jgi:hypothetical protein